MRSRALLAVAAIVLFGIVVTIVATSVAENAQAERTRAEAAVTAERMATNAQVALAGALDSAEAASTLSDLTWLTDTEYKTFWTSFDNTLPGDSTAILVVAVPAEDLDAFVAAEREANAGFEVISLNSNPPEGGHFLAMRGATDDLPLSIDLSSLPGTGAFFSSVGPGDTLLLDADVRRPGQSGLDQLQVVQQHQVTGPTGQRRDAWTTVQIDLAALFADVAQELDTSQGAAFATSINANAGTFGLAPNGDPLSSRTAVSDGVDVSVDVWSDGSATTGIKPETVRLIGAIATGVWVLLGLLGVAISALLRRLGESDRDARRDQLTALKNRRWLVERLTELDGRATSLLFCDIDRFKVVNDSADHLVGDELLLRVARRMESALASRADVVRFGGDEFIVVSDVPADTDPFTHGVEIASSIQAAMAPPFAIAGDNVHVTFSIGIAGTDATESLTGSELIRRADVAAGFCKQNGRNQYAVYDRKLRDAERDGLALESDLRAALDRADLVLHYQPIVDADGIVVSFESLVRWQRNGTLIPPNRFLPVVNEIGRMVDLGEIVLNGALGQLAAWIATGEHHPDLSIHVNVDPSQLRDPGFPDLIDDLLRKHKLAPSRVVLELTEGEWIDGVSGSQTVLDRLTDRGVGLAIDDFGSGYSSMARILDLENLVEIKIDRSIVSRVTEPRQEAFLLGLREIADRIEVALVAEGVETQEEHEALTAMGIGLFQGYFFGRPAPAAAVQDAMRSAERSPLTGVVAPDTVPESFTIEVAAREGND